MLVLSLLVFLNLMLVCQAWSNGMRIFGQKLRKAGVVSVATFTLATNFAPSPALADRPLNAPSAAGTRVNSDPESLLRYGLPINSKEMREIQDSIESIKQNLKTRRVNFAVGDLNKAKQLLARYEDKIMKAVPKEKASAAKESLARLTEDFPVLAQAMNTEMSAGSGSVQERDALDQAFAAQDATAKELSVLEETMVPESFKRAIPEEYANLPSLQGRATVEITMKKPDGSQFNVDGKLYDKVKMQMVIDGYNAPITGGNFLDLVNKKFYEGRAITRSDGFVVQTGDSNPEAEGEGTIHGYVPPGSREERKVPLEISLKGDKELLYGITSEDDGRGYAAAVLPFQSYGALGMARSEFEADSASSQFFWLLFESDLTPAGKNLLDGRYSCFGYTTEGNDLLKGVKEGDIIESIKIVKGAENLVAPKS